MPNQPYDPRNTWEARAADAVVDNAAKATGWLIGSGIAGLLATAERSRDRRFHAGDRKPGAGLRV